MGYQFLKLKEDSELFNVDGVESIRWKEGKEGKCIIINFRSGNKTIKNYSSKEKAQEAFTQLESALKSTVGVIEVDSYKS